jgi:hypothetical protein
MLLTRGIPSQKGNTAHQKKEIENFGTWLIGLDFAQTHRHN